VTTSPRVPDAPLEGFPDFDRSFAAAYACARDCTMTSPERMYALWKGVHHVLDRDVPGAFVECGVWRGGSSMLMAHALLECGDVARELWLYDTFEGMPQPGDADVDFTGRPAAEQLPRRRDDRDDVILAYATLDEVQANMRRVGYPSERVRYVRGPVEETIPGQAPESIAVLRLDTDWEASTRHELEYLWPRLSAGGLLVIDDYGHWAGARRAVDQYFAARDDAPLLVRVDYTGRVGVKLA
jgi:O-methyltransferase